MFIHRLNKGTQSGGSFTKTTKSRSKSIAKSTNNQFGSGIIREVYESSAIRPTDVLRNIQVSKSRMPKKYIVFE